MYGTNDGRVFRNFTNNLDDLMYLATKEENEEVFTERLNDEVDNIVSQGFKVVGLSYKIEAEGFCAVIEYAHNDNIYYEVEGGLDSNGTEQVQE